MGNLSVSAQNWDIKYTIVFRIFPRLSHMGNQNLKLSHSFKSAEMGTCDSGASRFFWLCDLKVCDFRGPQFPQCGLTRMKIGFVMVIL